MVYLDYIVPLKITVFSSSNEELVHFYNVILFKFTLVISDNPIATIDTVMYLI